MTATCDGCTDDWAEVAADCALSLEIAERRQDWGTVREIRAQLAEAARDLSAAGVLRRVAERSRG